MQENFVKCRLGALNLSWAHYIYALLHILKSNRATILLHLYVFGLPFPLSSQGIIARSDDRENMLPMPIFIEVWQKLSRLAIPVELLI